MTKQGKPRYGFIGSGAFAARCLDLLCEWKLPSWIVTAPPKAAGRGNRLTRTSVGRFVEERAIFSNVPLVESACASKDDRVFLMKRDVPVDFAFVIDFGQLIREPLLAWGEPIGCLNIHPSLLPRYRGAAPVQRALMDRVEETGVTIFKLAPGMDSGPVLLQRKIVVGEDDAGALLERAAVAGVAAFTEYAESTPMTEWRFAPQDDALATTAPKISKEEERIDWSRSAGEILRKIRALAPKPGAWTTFGEKRLRILGASASTLRAKTRPGTLTLDASSLSVSTGDGALSISLVQMEGKKVQSAAEWKNGLRGATEVDLV
ncbi:methionyl-tRNA formyltransferase [Synergistaceae bacterium OttesenSCG-928-I11]|nr:methionyl-tRNA formyltransferase [Synergistaceae bacterium OttesenSCG-928-I11]